MEEGDHFYMTNLFEKFRRKQGGPINRNNKMLIGNEGPEIFIPSRGSYEHMQFHSEPNYNVIPISPSGPIMISTPVYPRQESPPFNFEKQQWQCEYCGQTNHYIDTSCQYCGGRKPFHKSRF